MPTLQKIRPYWLPEKQKPFEGVERAESDNYNTRRWRIIRKEVLRKHPLCAECEKKGIVTEAKEVDHILSVKDGGSFWSYANLQGLCTKCHFRKTRLDMKKRKQ